MIFCDNCTQRFAIVFLTPGQLLGQMHAPRIHFKEHMHMRKLVCNTKSGPKNGVNFRTYNLLPSLLRAGFGGLATQLFPSFCPIIWGSIFGQHGRSCSDSLRARPTSPPKGLLAQSFLAQSYSYAINTAATTASIHTLYICIHYIYINITSRLYHIIICYPYSKNIAWNSLDI